MNEGSPDISDMLSGLMSDPEMLSKAISMASMLKESGIADSLFGASKGASGGTSPSSEGSAKAAREVKKESRPSGANEARVDISESTDSEEQRIRSEKTPLDLGKKSKGGKSDRVKLLSALCPYLSSERREKAEMLIGILTVMDMSGSLFSGLSSGALGSGKRHGSHFFENGEISADHSDKQPDKASKAGSKELENKGGEEDEL